MKGGARTPGSWRWSLALRATAAASSGEEANRPGGVSNPMSRSKTLLSCSRSRIADPLAGKLAGSLGPGPEVRERFLEAVAAAYRQRFG